MGASNMFLLPEEIADEHWRSVVDAYLRLNGLSDQLFRSRDVRVGISYRKATSYFHQHSLEVSLLGQPERCGFTQPHHLYSDGEYGPLRFCPLCRSEDLAKYGYARWRYTHQKCSVNICPDHGCLLLRGCTQCRYTPGNVDGLDACHEVCQTCSSPYPVAFPDHKEHARRLLFTRFLQAQSLGFLTLPTSKQWITILQRKAMETYGVSERGVPARLRREIERTFPDDLLYETRRHPREGIGAGWLKLFFYGFDDQHDIYANALIGAVLFHSLEEWQAALSAATSLPHYLWYENRIRTTPLPPQLMKALAWHSDLRSIAAEHGVNNVGLQSMVTHFPELRAARSTPLMQAKQVLTKGKYQLLGKILKTKSSKKILAALYRAETRYSGTASALSKTTIDAAKANNHHQQPKAITTTAEVPSEDVLVSP